MLREKSVPVLSVCIATYQRCDMVTRLIKDFLTVDADIEILAHIDGSSDGTLESLNAIKDDRLSVTISENRGRAPSIFEMVNKATGLFTMIYDDDDIIYLDGLRKILIDCEKPLPSDVCGYIYHYHKPTGQRLGSDFSSTRSNFLKIRADEKVVGDKNEVVKTSLLQSVIIDPSNKFRRIPTSLGWAKLALEFDVMCRNIDIGRHDYQPGGMSLSITELKRADPWPIYITHRTRLTGWFKGRYQSFPYALRSAVAAIRYWIATLSSNKKPLA